VDRPLCNASILICNAVNLPAVADESYGESTMVASTSGEKTVEESGGNMDRMTLWIKSVESRSTSVVPELN
jgi:hypothetical protein